MTNYFCRHRSLTGCTQYCTLKLMNTIAISDLRTNLPLVISQTADKLKRFIITVSGQPKAVLISLEELESLQETAEVLSIPGILESLKESKKQARKGELISLQELKEKYL